MNKKIETIKKMELIDIYRTLQLTKEYAYCSNAYGTFKGDHVLGYKTYI